MAAKSGKKWWIIGGVGCLGILLIIGLCVGGFGLFAWNTTQKMKAGPDAFMTAMQSDDYSAAYAVLDDGFKANVSNEEFTAEMTAMTALTGSVVSWNMIGFNAEASGGQTAGTYRGAVEFTNENGRVQFEVGVVGEDWVIRDYNFDYPSEP